MNEIDNAFGFNEQPSGKVNEEKYKQAGKGLGDNAAEMVISVVAYATLILGILCSLIACIILMDHHSTETMGFVVLFCGSLSSVITWAFLIVIANISNNIRQIKYELRKKNENA